MKKPYICRIKHKSAMEDPLEHLMKTTGWSCEDLLERLQKLKSAKTTNGGKEANTLNQHSQKTDKKNESSKSSTESCSEKTLERGTLSIDTESFTDTDDEEQEVQNTNKLIINEIIDDISTVDIQMNSVDTYQAQETETMEVTEVRVIEVNNEDEEDDNFEDESMKEIQYLETYPRRSVCLDEQRIGLKRKLESQDEESPGKINYVETYPRKRAKELEDVSTGDEGVDNDVGKTILKTNNTDIEKSRTGKAHREQESSLQEKSIPQKQYPSHHLQEDLKPVDVDNDGDHDATSENYSSENDDDNSSENEENNVCFFSDNDASMNEDENTTSENQEDLRNNLKLQLNSLRTRKKEHFLEAQTKVVDTFECSKKLSHLMSLQDESNGNLPATEQANNSNIFLDQSLEGNNLFHQTDELGLVILNVQGGVDLEETAKEVNDCIDSTMENNGSTSDFDIKSALEDDQHAVLNQIRQIISKQKSSKPSSNTNHCQPAQHDKNEDKPSTLSSENSQSSFINDTHDLEEISPFVSNSLDEFLTGNSKLNISYNVPKCRAEEGLKGIRGEDSSLVLKSVIDVKEVPADRPKKKSTVKAKTVAQKRKLLEREKMREKRRLERLQKMTSSKLKQERNIEGNHSYVLFNNEKVFVKSQARNKCIAKIICSDTKTSPNNSQRHKKLSLLGDQRKTEGKVKYLPGPLCKKSNLQISGQNDWVSEAKTLPRIFLEVAPKIGQPFPDTVIDRLKIFDGELDSEQIEFALSVVKTKINENNPRTFSFPLKYCNNQEKIIVRKKVTWPVHSRPEVSPIRDQKRSTDTIADVVEDLIRYVEIRELAPTLIKEDESYAKREEELDTNLSPINSNISIFKKPQKRRSKVETELLRLNCKLVNVEVEEDETELACDKPHCRLGCVCKSLKCESMFNYRCQKSQCMFECTCPKEKTLVYDHSVTLPAGTDLLSTDTVNRIEDEAKKDLAKVEREFTQTVIHTNDKTIVVGLGTRSKFRRHTKTPAKYSDYVESPDGCDVSKIKTPEVDFLAKCVVSLPKLNLQGVIPFCLAHNLYDCHCRGRSACATGSPAQDDLKGRTYFRPRPRKFTIEVSEDEHEDSQTNARIQKLVEKNPKPIVKKDKSGGKKEPANMKYSTRIQTHVSSDFDDTPSETSSVHSVSDNVEAISASGRPVRNMKKKLSEDFVSEPTFIPADCARTRLYNYKSVRGSTYDVAGFQNDFTYNLTDADVLKARLQTNNKKQKLLEADILKHIMIEECLGKKLDGISRRKQTLSVRDEGFLSEAESHYKDGAIQRRKKSLLLAQRSKELKPVFEGEIIIDRRNMELLRKMGPKTVQDGYARLLPWRALTDSFKNGSVNIWSMIDQPSRLLINKSDKKAPKNYVNIKQSNQTTEVILWILKNRLPPNYQEDSVSFILKETKDNFEICGVCTRNFTDFPGVAERTEPATSSQNKEDVFVHCDLYAQRHSLEIKKERFKLQELVEESTGHLGETSIDKTNLYMWAALPEIYRVCKWRVIYLNSDFTYLHFPGIKYSIRYTDLLNAGNIAKRSKVTVRLKSDRLQSGYDHIDFGMYFDPHYSDRVFIGPYFKQYLGSDVETLRYINKKLVSTTSFNKLRGKTDYKCGHWLVERPYGSRRSPPESRSSTIDLTNEDDDGGGASMVVTMQASATDTTPMVIMHNSERIEIIDAPPRKPEEFNRYMVTNIPHFGYLGAYRHPSGQIDVSWPFEEKMLRFSKVATAVEFLQDRFSVLLQSVPDTFKIKVIVLNEIDLENAMPIDSSVLTGHFICGEFGFHNITTMTDEDCKINLGMSREAVLKMFSKRAQLFLRKRIEQLASLLNLEKKDNNDLEIADILSAATAEIHSQIDQAKKNVALKTELTLMKRERALKLFSIISKLPTEQRNVESLKFRRLLNKTEPIEIADSDDETSRHLGTDESSDKDSMKHNAPAADTLKVLDPQQCVQSVMKAKSYVGSTAVPKKVKPINSPMHKSPPYKMKMKSVLKPLIRVPINQETSLLARGQVPTDKNDNQQIPSNSKLHEGHYISGVKLVKSTSGNFVLVTDQNTESKHASLSMGDNKVSSTKVIIQNNKVKTVRRILPKQKAIVSLDESQSPPKAVVNCQSAKDSSPLDSHYPLFIDLDKSNEDDEVLGKNRKVVIRKIVSSSSSSSSAIPEKVCLPRTVCDYIDDSVTFFDDDDSVVESELKLERTIT